MSSKNSKITFKLRCKIGNFYRIANNPHGIRPEQTHMLMDLLEDIQRIRSSNISEEEMKYIENVFTNLSKFILARK